MVGGTAYVTAAEAGSESTGKAHVHAVDAATGASRWKAVTSDDAIGLSPAAADSRHAYVLVQEAGGEATYLYALRG